MKHLLYILLFFVCACANRNKAEITETKLNNQTQAINNQGESIGVRDQEFVLQKKKNLSEEIRTLEEKIRELDDHVYGTREYNTFGIWGKLRDCRNKLTANAKDYEAGPVERFTDSDYLLNWKENSHAKAAIEKSSEKLVALSEEDLDDHIRKLNKAKLKLQEKEDEIQDKLSKCLSLAK